MLKFRVLFVLLMLSQTLSAQNQQEQDSTSKAKNVQVVPFPNISNNQIFGWGGGVNVAVLYKLNKKDTLSPVNTTVLQPMYFQNGTWWAALYNEFYWGENKWRGIFLAYAQGVNFQFYTQSYFPNFQDQVIAYNTKGYSTSFSLMRRIFPDFYAGLQYIFTRNSVNFEGYDRLDEYLSRFGYTENTESGLGFTINYDKRDNIYDPSKGIYWIANSYSYREWLGSSVEYNFILTELSYYTRLSPKLIWASKGAAQIAFGDVPFVDENVQGFGGMRFMDLRGYNKGQFRGDQMYNLQTEFRYNFYGRYSANLYLGSGTVFTDPQDAEYLPAIGLGARYLASKKYKVKVGVDYAWGKNDHGIYFLIGEAF